MYNMFSKNTRYPHFKQQYYTVGDWDQFNTNVILDNYDECIDNTFKYIFHKFKKGIFVHIKDGKLYKFVAFCKANYINEFSSKLVVDPEYKSWGNMFEYIKQHTNQTYQIDIDTKYAWWANNGLIRYEKSKYEQDIGVDYIYTILSKMLNKYQVSDCTFFINKRDFPILKSNGTEPYHSIWGTDTPLVSHSYQEYADILSMTGSKNYRDIPVPTWDDYNRETTKINVSDTEWVDKLDKAVFRGSSTGLGTTLKTNPRIKILKLAQDNSEYLDAGITKWNLRPRKTITDIYYKTISKKIIDKYPIVPFLNYEEQSKYKYIINLPGHVSSFRLGTLFKLKCVVLHIPNTEYYIWYEHLLKPYIHYIPLDKDLKNLVNQIKWCQKNPDLCKTIIKNATAFYNKYLTLEGQLKWWYDIVETCGNYYNPIIFPLKEVTLQHFSINTTTIQPVLLSGICKNKDLYLIENRYLLKPFVSSELDNYFKYIEGIKHSYMTIDNEYKGWRTVYGTIDYQDKKYLVLDYIHRHLSLYDYLYNFPHKGRDMIDINVLQDCLLQICVLLDNAYKTTKYIHNDCVPWNILISIDYQNLQTVFIQNGNQEYVFSNTPSTLYLIDYEKGKTGQKNECRDMFGLLTHILFIVFNDMYNYPEYYINMCVQLFHDLFPNNDCENVKEIIRVLNLFKKYDNMTSVNLSSINPNIDLTDYTQIFNLLQKHFQSSIIKRPLFTNANNLYKQYLSLKN